MLLPLPLYPVESLDFPPDLLFSVPSACLVVWLPSFGLCLWFSFALLLTFLLPPFVFIFSTFLARGVNAINFYGCSCRRSCFIWKQKTIPTLLTPVPTQTQEWLERQRVDGEQRVGTIGTLRICLEELWQCQQVAKDWIGYSSIHTAQMAIDSCNGVISKGGVKIYHWWWDESIWFHDGDRQHHLCLHDAMQLLLEMVKPYNDMFSISFTFSCTIWCSFYFTGNDETCERDVFHFFVVLTPGGAIYALDGEMHNKRFHIYFSCMENAIQFWMCGMKWKIDFFLISFTFCFGDREFSLNLWGFSMSRLSMMKELCNVLNSEGIQNLSCQQIWGRHHERELYALQSFYLEIRRQHVFGWKRWCLKCSPRFSITQTCC